MIFISQLVISPVVIRIGIVVSIVVVTTRIAESLPRYQALHASFGCIGHAQAHFVERVILVVRLAGKLGPEDSTRGILRTGVQRRWLRWFGNRSRDPQASKHPIVLSVSRSPIAERFFPTDICQGSASSEEESSAG